MRQYEMCRPVKFIDVFFDSIKAETDVIFHSNKKKAIQRY